MSTPHISTLPNALPMQQSQFESLQRAFAEVTGQLSAEKEALEKAEREIDRFKTLWDHTERERDELAAALESLPKLRNPKFSDDAGENIDKLGKDDVFDLGCDSGDLDCRKAIHEILSKLHVDPKSILAAHDAALVKPLVEALTDLRTMCCRFGDFHYRAVSEASQDMISHIDAVLAPYKKRPDYAGGA